jgi:hypothetical protein
MTDQGNSATVTVNFSHSPTIFTTLIFAEEFKAEIKKSLICSNCKNPIDKCGICGRVFKSRDPVFCSLTNVHYCKRCVKRIKKSQERYRPKKRGLVKSV